MKLSDIVRLFDGMEVINAKEVCDCEISTVTVMDAPDIYNWMKGGEFVISSGYPYKDNKDGLEYLITELKSNKASALGLKLDRFIHEVPEYVVKKADELNFPIVYIPEKYAFSEIINPVLYNIANENYLMLRKIDDIRNYLTNLLVEGCEIKDVVSFLNEQLKTDIVFYNNLNCEFIKNGKKLNKAEEINYRHKEEVILKGKKFGTLFFQKSYTSHDYVENSTIEYGATIINLLIQQKILEKTSVEQFKSQLATDLCNNNISNLEEVIARSSLQGWKIENGIQIVIYDVDNYKKNTVENSNEQDILEDKKDLLFNLILKNDKEWKNRRGYFKKSDSLVILYSLDFIKEENNKKLLNLIENTKEKIKENSDFNITVGIGNYYLDILDTYLSYESAMDAIKFGRAFFGDDKIHYYKDISFYKGIYIQHKQDSSYYKENLELIKIKRYDQANNTELMETLISLVENDWNIALTSRKLFLHYNTVKYRYEQILKLLDKTEFTVNDKALLFLEIKFNEIIDITEG